jgi:hypothetical protein
MICYWLVLVDFKMLKSRLGEGNVLESMTEFTFVKHVYSQ